MIYEETLKKAIETYGEELQKIVAVEEMAELTQALVKNIRGADNRDNIAEEIADVLIMLGQLQLIFGNADQVRRQKVVKIRRLRERLEDAK